MQWLILRPLNYLENINLYLSHSGEKTLIYVCIYMYIIIYKSLIFILRHLIKKKLQNFVLKKGVPFISPQFMYSDHLLVHPRHMYDGLPWWYLTDVSTMIVLWRWNYSFWYFLRLLCNHLHRLLWHCWQCQSNVSTRSGAQRTLSKRTVYGSCRLLCIFYFKNIDFSILSGNLVKYRAESPLFPGIGISLLLSHCRKFHQEEDSVMSFFRRNLIDSMGCGGNNACSQTCFYHLVRV